MALDERITRWFEYRKYIAMRARMIFTQSLQNRGYHGQIKFNHKEQKLALFVCSYFSFIFNFRFH